MPDNKVKLQILKKVANDGTIEVICDVLLEILEQLDQKQPMGFIPGEDK